MDPKKEKTYYGAGGFTVGELVDEALEIFADEIDPDGCNLNTKALKRKVTKAALRRFFESREEQRLMNEVQNDANDLMFYARQDALRAFLKSIDKK